MIITMKKSFKVRVVCFLVILAAGWISGFIGVNPLDTADGEQVATTSTRSLA